MGMRKGGGGGGHRSKGGAGRKPPGKSKKRKAEKSVDDPLTKLSRSERRHIKEYGALHPVHSSKSAPVPEEVLKAQIKMDRLQSSQKRREEIMSRNNARKRPVAQEVVDDAQEAESSSSDDEVDPFEQLLSQARSRGTAKRILERQKLADEAEKRATGLDAAPVEAAESSDGDHDSEANDEEIEIDENEYEEVVSRLKEGEELVPADVNVNEATVENYENILHGDEEIDGDSDDNIDVEDDSDDEDVIENGRNSDPFDFRFNPGSESELFREIEQTIIEIESSMSGKKSTTLLSSGKKRIIKEAPPVLKVKSSSFGTARLATRRSWWGLDECPSEGKIYRPPQTALKDRISLSKLDHDFTEAQHELLNQFGTYRDVLFPFRSPDIAERIRETYVLHALNHVIKTRNRILKHNAKVAADPTKEFEDQGFTRPKVLVLLPYKSCAFKTIQLMEKLVVDPNAKKGDRSVRNGKRFVEEFAPETDDKSPPHPNPGYRYYFDGQNDDCFRIGVSLTRTSLNLYTPFYNSDIILASPLGLRLIIGGEGEQDRDFDFLSSLEVVIIDQAESLAMQNWSHLEQLMGQLNMKPSKTRDTDFSRVRRWTLNGWSKYFRQTLLISAFNTPDLTHLLKTQSNFYGSITFSRKETGSIVNTIIQVPQAFHRIKCKSLVSSPDDRFDFFVGSVMPEYASESRRSILVYIPDYFDFVRLRNHFRSEQISFGQICEYTTPSNVSRARSYLFHGERKYFLYTGRFHYHFRPRLRGIKHIIFYGLPEFAEFYPELLSYMAPGDDITCTVIYSKYDALSLQRIVGTTRYQRMLLADSSVHLFA